MGFLTIDEVIAHCERKCASLNKYKDSLPKKINDLTVNLEYWEHYHVREWLKELQQYRAIGGTPELLIKLINFLGNDEDNSIINDLELLNQYRATGLTPDQIQKVDKLYREKCEELAAATRGM